MVDVGVINYLVNFHVFLNRWQNYGAVTTSGVNWEVIRYIRRKSVFISFHHSPSFCVLLFNGFRILEIRWVSFHWEFSKWLVTLEFVCLFISWSKLRTRSICDILRVVCIFKSINWSSLLFAFFHLNGSIGHTWCSVEFFLLRLPQVRHCISQSFLIYMILLSQVPEFINQLLLFNSQLLVHLHYLDLNVLFLSFFLLKLLVFNLNSLVFRLLLISKINLILQEFSFLLLSFKMVLNLLDFNLVGSFFSDLLHTLFFDHYLVFDLFLFPVFFQFIYSLSFQSFNSWSFNAFISLHFNSF